MKTRITLTMMLLKLVTAAELPRQCSTEFPNGSPCDVAGISLADPDSCYHYYQCMETGCVEQLECGQHLVFDDQVTFMCQDSAQVNCGSRPCTDPQHCTPASTQSPEDCTPPDQWIDCHETGPGYWPDPFNCRRYWQCDVTGAATHHLCEDNMMYDLVYDGCNYEKQTECGDRPKCDECNQDCKPPCHHEFDCSDREDGLYADAYSCERWWECSHGVSYHQKCPQGLYFEPVKGWCDYPGNVECGNRPPCDECLGEC